MWLLRPKRLFSLLALSLLAVAMYLQARGMARLLAASLLPSGPPPRRVSVVPDEEASTPRATQPRAPVAPPRVEPSRGGDTVDPLGWPACKGVEVLIVSESRDPWWSLTTVREAGLPRARLRRVGDSVLDLRIAFIGFNPRQQAPSVWLEGNGTFCQSSLHAGAPSVSETAVVRTTLPTAATRIERSADGAMRIERSLVEQTLQDPSTLMRTVRVIPDKQDGAIVGLRLAGLRPGTLLYELGLRNGDRLESINGFAMTTPEQALQAYAGLRTAERLRVRLDRGGSPVQLDVRID